MRLSHNMYIFVCANSKKTNLSILIVVKYHKTFATSFLSIFRNMLNILQMNLSENYKIYIVRYSNTKKITIM